MKFSIDWNLAGLRENPFTTVPPLNPHQAVWVGMDTLKEEFNHVFREAKASAPTQVVLCRGPVGSGKTHASLFFSREENLPVLSSHSVQHIEICRAHTPTEVDNPTRDFYLDVMEQIGLERIKETVTRTVESVGHTAARKALRQTMLSTALVDALLGLAEESVNPLLSAYFLGKCTTTELRKLGLNRNIEKTQDYFRVLAGVFHCFTGLAESTDVTEHRRFCLWIDEMENFIYFTPPQYRPFGQGLRELVDRLPYFFTLFMNFTLTAPEEYEEIELILGTYLIDRVTQQIFFHEMEEDAMLHYVNGLLSHYRTQAGPKTCYAPFTEDALKLLLTNLQRRTPRDVNKRCRNALLKAFETGVFETCNGAEITVDFVRKMSLEELDREMG